ncbi:hypothetical protein [Lentilactobacillus senioris]|uniref:hypothetical protein n=1 Tax=Lentilactobacillus senioris TaxID=931534 RepID=UPI003D2951C7
MGAILNGTMVWDGKTPPNTQMVMKEPFFMLQPSSNYWNGIADKPTNYMVSNGNIELTAPISKLKNGIQIIINHVIGLLSYNAGASNINGGYKIFEFGSTNSVSNGSLFTCKIQTARTINLSLDKLTSEWQSIATMSVTNPWNRTFDIYIKAVDDTHITFKSGGNDGSPMTGTPLDDLSGTSYGAYYLMIDSIKSY